MRIPGQRIKRTRLIQTEKYVIAVDVEMVIPPDDPSEPCYESETVQLLREVKERAEQGSQGNAAPYTGSHLFALSHVDVSCKRPQLKIGTTTVDTRSNRLAAGPPK